MFKKLLFSLLLASALGLTAFAADAPETTAPAPQPAEKTTTQTEPAPLPSSIKHLDLVLVLDKSGSMYGLESDTIGGYNAMIDKEKELDVDTKVTTVLFSNQMTTLYDRVNINSLQKLTNKDYRVGGSTALLDAVGDTIAKISATPDIDAADHKVVFVIITDGKENASQEYSKAQVKQMISDKQKAGWDFVFLGANIDAASEASSIGIDSNNAVKYQNTSKGVRQNFAAVAAFARSAVQQKNDGSWKNLVERDN